MHHDSSRRPPRSHRAALPARVALRDAASPARNGAPLTQTGMAVLVVPGFACKDENKAGDYRAVPLFSGFRRPRFLRVGGAIATLARGTRPHSTATTPPPQRSPVPPVRHHAEPRARWLQPQSFHNSRASSPQVRDATLLSGPSTPVPSPAAKAAAPCHPRPAWPCPSPLPASCAATAAR